jgi:hypothetical protein
LNHCISQGLDDRVINKELTPRERVSSFLPLTTWKKIETTCLGLNCMSRYFLTRFDESVTDLRKLPKWRDSSYNATDPERKIVFRRIQQDIIE